MEKANKEAQIQLKKAQTELTNLRIANGGSAPRKSSGGGRRGGGSGGGRGFNERDVTTERVVTNKDGSTTTTKTTTQYRKPQRPGRELRNGKGGSGKVSNNSGFFNK